MSKNCFLRHFLSDTGKVWAYHSFTKNQRRFFVNFLSSSLKPRYPCKFEITQAFFASGGNWIKIGLHFFKYIIRHRDNESSPLLALEFRTSPEILTKILKPLPMCTSVQLAIHGLCMASQFSLHFCFWSRFVTFLLLTCFNFMKNYFWPKQQ